MRSPERRDHPFERQVRKCFGLEREVVTKEGERWTTSTSKEGDKSHHVWGLEETRTTFQWNGLVPAGCVSSDDRGLYYRYGTFLVPLSPLESECRRETDESKRVTVQVKPYRRDQLVFCRNLCSRRVSEITPRPTLGGDTCLMVNNSSRRQIWGRFWTSSPCSYSGKTGRRERNGKGGGSSGLSLTPKEIESKRDR